MVLLVVILQKKEKNFPAMGELELQTMGNFMYFVSFRVVSL